MTKPHMSSALCGEVTSVARGLGEYPGFGTQIDRSELPAQAASIHAAAPGGKTLEFYIHSAAIF